MSGILTVKSCALDNVSLSFPENNNGILYSELSNNKEPLYIQTPKMTYQLGKNFIKLLFVNKNGNNQNLVPFFDIIKKIEKKTCDLISSSSESWFSDKIDSDVISNDLFKSCISLPDSLLDTLGMKVNIPNSNETGEPDVEIYNKLQKKLDFSTLEKGTTRKS